MLSLICNDFMNVIGPTRAAVSPVGTLPAVGPGCGGLQHERTSHHMILSSEKTQSY